MSAFYHVLVLFVIFASSKINYLQAMSSRKVEGSKVFRQSLL